jgi:hypothetical protein
VSLSAAFDDAFWRSERSRLLLQISSSWFAPLGNSFLKKANLDCAGASPTVAHQKSYRAHKNWCSTLAKALDIADRAWRSGNLP